MVWILRKRVLVDVQRESTNANAWLSRPKVMLFGPALTARGPFSKVNSDISDQSRHRR